MPQDELWAASARLIGCTYTHYLDVKGEEVDTLLVSPHWSKIPARKDIGCVGIAIPTYARDYLPALISAAHFELTGGLARNVPGVVRSRLRQLQDGFAQGALQ